MNWQKIIDATPVPSGELGEELWFAQVAYGLGAMRYKNFIDKLNAIFDEMVKV